jgi:hypothetical protein
MPKKGASKKGRRNNQLWVTLPAGARYQLDQLVALKTEGDSHSEIIRAMVISQLRTMRREYDLKRMPPISEPGSANSPSTDATPDFQSRLSNR